IIFFFSSRRRHTRSKRDWSSDVCSSDLEQLFELFSRIRQFLLQCVDVADLIVAWFAFIAKNGAIELIGVLSQPLFARNSAAFRRSEERRVGKECRSRWSSKF